MAKIIVNVHKRVKRASVRAEFLVGEKKTMPSFTEAPFMVKLDF